MGPWDLGASQRRLVTPNKKAASPLHPPKKNNAKILPVCHSLPICLEPSVDPILAIASVHSNVFKCNWVYPFSS